MSQKTSWAPWRAYASPVVVNVKEGTMTVSAGPTSSASADSSSAAVHDVVISTSSASVASASSAAARSEYGPPEEG